MGTVAAVCAADGILNNNPHKNSALLLGLDGKATGDGLVGTVWERAMTAYLANSNNW